MFALPGLRLIVRRRERRLRGRILAWRQTVLNEAVPVVGKKNIVVDRVRDPENESISTKLI